jgi:hypothetical protein
LAPVDVSLLGSSRGVQLAKSRIRAGAELLLAQPPTTDSGETLDRHLALLGASGLRNRVLLNVFPFRDKKDVLYCEKYFGWRLPRALHKMAGSGQAALLEEARRAARRIRREGLPGVYVSTRGHTDVAKKILA